MEKNQNLSKVQRGRSTTEAVHIVKKQTRTLPFTISFYIIISFTKEMVKAIVIPRALDNKACDQT